MTKIQLMQALAEIPDDYPIMVEVPTDDLLDDYNWMMMKHVEVVGVKDVYRIEEYVFTDIDDLSEHFECCENITDEEEIQRQIEKTPHEKMIVIRVQS